MPDNSGGNSGDNSGNSMFQRLVDRVAPPPAVTSQPAPSSAYTQDVIARGSQAVQDRARGLAFDNTQGTQKLNWEQQTGIQSNDPTQAYMDWYASKGFQPPSPGPVRFGQSAKGAYAGFKTEGDLKAAISGRADQARMADVAAAQSQYNDAAQTLGSLNTAYDQQRTQKDQAIAALAPSVAGMGLGHMSTPDFGLDNTGPRQQMVAPTAADNAQATADAGRVNQLAAHGEALNRWLADSAQPSLQDMSTARQIESTPLRVYQQQAGHSYGVDPNIAAGWFPQSGDATDYTNQRNLQSIQDYGVPYNDFNTYVADQQRQQDAAAKQQTVDAATAEKTATKASQAQVADVVGQATGLDATQLAQSVNMTPEQVAHVVSDPTFQQASKDLQSVLFDPQFDPSNKNDAAAVSQVLDQPIIRSNPQLLSILMQVYKNYIG